MNFLPYIGKRLLQLLPVLFGISLVVFVLVHLIPGEPADVLLGQNATPARVKIVNHKLGLDRPLWFQYFSFLSRTLHGSLGTSFYNKVPVTTLINGRLLVTVMLLTGGILFSLMISVPLAVV